MPASIARILDCGYVALFARIALTFPFWASGLSKLIDFSGGTAEMAHFGLQPAAPSTAPGRSPSSPSPATAIRPTAIP